MAPDSGSFSRRHNRCNLVGCAGYDNTENGPKDKPDGDRYFWTGPYPERFTFIETIGPARLQINRLPFGLHHLYRRKVKKSKQIVCKT